MCDILITLNKIFFKRIQVYLNNKHIQKIMYKYVYFKTENISFIEFILYRPNYPLNNVGILQIKIKSGTDFQILFKTQSAA